MEPRRRFKGLFNITVALAACTQLSWSAEATNESFIKACLKAFMGIGAEAVEQEPARWKTPAEEYLENFEQKEGLQFSVDRDVVIQRTVELLKKQKKAVKLLSGRNSENETEKTALQDQIEFFQDREIIPEGGSVYVVGPWDNYREWLVPLAARRDIKISIAEIERSFTKYQDLLANKDDELRSVWDTSQQSKDFFQGKGFPLPFRSFDEFQSAVKKQIKVYDGVINLPNVFRIDRYNNQVREPYPDLIIAMAPQYYGRQFSNFGGEGTLIWTSTEGWGAFPGFSDNPTEIPAHATQVPFRRPPTAIYLGDPMVHEAYIYVIIPSAQFKDVRGLE